MGALTLSPPWPPQFTQPLWVTQDPLSPRGSLGVAWAPRGFNSAASVEGPGVAHWKGRPGLGQAEWVLGPPPRASLGRSLVER